MRPIKLHIEGFNSFRDHTEVDFTSLDLFVITGPTGAGKTSLIDAIIFALYGRTPRIGEKSISELISQGNERVRVLLQFKAGDKQYQIVRTLKRGGSTKVQLEVQNADGATWEPLSNKVAEVRSTIEQIIGLDFEGFIKSVVLPQGEFDQFLRGDRQERRHIISELLNLSIYVEMGQRARQKAEAGEREAFLIEQHLADAYQDVTEDKKKVLSSDLKGFRRESQRLSAELKILRELQPIASLLKHLRKSHTDLSRDAEVAAKDLRLAKEATTSAEAEIGRHERTIKEIEEALRSAAYDQSLHHKLLTTIPLAEQRESLLASIDSDQKQRTQSIGESDTLRPKVSKAHKEAQEAKSALDAADKSVSDANDAYKSAKKQHGSIEAVGLAREELVRLEEMNSEQQELRKNLREAESERELTKGRLETCLEEEKAARHAWKEAREHLEQLQQLHAIDELRKKLKKGEPCTVCEQVVLKVPKTGDHPALNRAREAVEKTHAAVERLHDATEKLANRQESLPSEIQDLKKRLTKVENSVDSIRAKLQKIVGKSELSGASRELDRIERKLVALDDALELAKQKHERAAKQYQDGQTAFAKLERSLALCDQKLSSLEETLSQKQETLAALNNKLKGSYDLPFLRKQLSAQEKAKKAQDECEKNKNATEQQRIAAEKRAAVARADASSQQKRNSDLNKQIAKIEEQIDTAQNKIRKQIDLPKACDEPTEVEQRRSSLERDAQEVSAKIAVNESEIQRIQKALLEVEAKRQQVNAIREKVLLYKELGMALRADQFIRFIEEEALQRLADGGSGHLLQLSSGRYSFSTSGDEFFAIDHWNADEPRSVNTLSGGESFLASLALALALADTLAEFASEREHFSLDSLFLDEGFSTLDPETLDVAVQGIESLAGGDRLIGVISHISELAERFPVHIEVKKAIAGSTLHIRGESEKPAATTAHA